MASFYAVIRIVRFSGGHSSGYLKVSASSLRNAEVDVERICKDCKDINSKVFKEFFPVSITGFIPPKIGAQAFMEEEVFQSNFTPRENPVPVA